VSEGKLGGTVHCHASFFFSLRMDIAFFLFRFFPSFPHPFFWYLVLLDQTRHGPMTDLTLSTLMALPPPPPRFSLTIAMC
jgi:hypothetical protein